MMHITMRAALSAGLLLAASVTAFAQTSSPPGQPQQPTASTNASSGQAANRIEGTVESIDPNQGKLSVRGSDGKIYTFNASKETLQEYKVGDHIAANLRSK